MKRKNTRGIANLTHIQSFYSAAKHGSLGAAARAEGGSAPTLSRHIAALEDMYGLTLFDRRGDGLSLTQTGARLFEHAQAARDAVQQFDAAATNPTNEIAGVVRISASRHFANAILPQIIASLGDTYPEISIELVVTDLTSNLLMREADMAIRMFRPKQSRLFAKKVGDICWGAYASKTYIKQKGVPLNFDDLKHFDIIGDDNSEQINRELGEMGVKMTKDYFRYRCDDPSIAWCLILAGCGIGLSYTIHAKNDDRVERILQDAPEMKRPVWLTSNAELKTSARVRVVFDFLASKLSRRLAA